MVDIITRKPLEFRKALTLEGSLRRRRPARHHRPAVQRPDQLEEPENTLGVMMQLFSQKRHLRRDSIETLGYSTIAGRCHRPPDLFGRGGYPNAIGSALFEQERGKARRRPAHG